MKIAVCIPTWNRVHTLPVALNSLLNQQGYEFDIHVFDNASTDNTEELVHSYDAKNLFYHKNLSNIGYVGNLNNCLSLAQDYDWIGILHSDDCHFGESVASVAKYFDNYPNSGVVFSKYHQLNSDGEIIQRRIGEETVWKAGLEAVDKCQEGIPCSSSFFKSRAIIELGLYSEEFPYSADEEYNCRLASKYDVVETKEILAGYRRHEGHTMIQTWRKKDFIQSFEKMRLVMAEYNGSSSEEVTQLARKRIAVTLQGSAAMLAAEGHWYSTLRFHLYAIRHNPKSYLSAIAVARAILECTPFLGQVFFKSYYRYRLGWEVKKIGQSSS